MSACPGNADGYPYVWVWRTRTWTIRGVTVRAPWFGDSDRKGMRCRVLVRGGMNSALVEFEDGHRVITSRNGLRKVTVGGEGARAGRGALFSTGSRRG